MKRCTRKPFDEDWDKEELCLIVGPEVMQDHPETCEECEYYKE